MSGTVVLAALGALLVSGCPTKTPEARDTDTRGATVERRANGEATLLLMADLRGVLRPCGCTVELQKGGFDRLIPYLSDVRSRYPAARLLHTGPVFFEDAVVDEKKAAQRERQSEVAADLIATVGIDAAGATAVDVAAGGSRLKPLVEKARLTLTAANLSTSEDLDTKPWLVREIGSLRIGIFALASPEHATALGALGTVTDPRGAAVKALAELQGRADVVVLLSALGLRETKRLVRRVPGIHFAIAGGLGEHPAYSDEAELVGTTRVMQFHREGRYIGRLSLRVVNGKADFVDASQVSQAELDQLDRRIAELAASLAKWEAKAPDSYDVRSAKHHLASLRDERARLGARKTSAPTDRSSFSFTQTPLNWDLPQDPDILSLMDAFDAELARINIANAGTLPAAKPGEAVYVGVDTCLGCHDEVAPFWEGDRHRQAWETLEKGHKTFDAECVSCHVTGYNRPGGSLVGQTAGREDVQCEACHGPGSLHAEDGDADLIVARPPEDTCTTCHNTHHSPSFDFATYRRKLMVPGHGMPSK